MRNIRAPRTFWYVRSADGVEIGPISKSALDQMALDGRLGGASRIRQQGWSDTVPSTSVYPGLPDVVTTPYGEPLQPTPTTPLGLRANPLLQTRENVPQAGEAPAIGAPVRTTDPALVIAAIVLGSVIGPGWIGVRHSWQELSPPELLAWLACYELGAFFIGAAVFNWRFFWTLRKTRFLSGIMGEKAARWLYAIGGGALAIFALVQLR